MTDENDKRIYALSAHSIGIKSGDRMTFEGKRRKQSGGALVFEVQGIAGDFGSCQP